MKIRSKIMTMCLCLLVILVAGFIKHASVQAAKQPPASVEARFEERGR